MNKHRYRMIESSIERIGSLSMEQYISPSPTCSSTITSHPLYILRLRELQVHHPPLQLSFPSLFPSSPTMVELRSGKTTAAPQMAGPSGGTKRKATDSPPEEQRRPSAPFDDDYNNDDEPSRQLLGELE